MLQQQAASFTRLRSLDMIWHQMSFEGFSSLRAWRALTNISVDSVLPQADGSVGALESLPPALKKLKLSLVENPLKLPWLTMVGVGAGLCIGPAFATVHIKQQ